MTIAEHIVATRRRRIAREGHEQGTVLPRRREVPLVAFPQTPGLICEFKRRSPSRGPIAPDEDAVAQVRRYAHYGARAFSVLTEQDSFAGSLDDLIAVKRALPQMAILRKDFLFDPEDIDCSWRAGADALLLIASLLDERRLRLLHDRARRLGMAVLVEVHSAHEVAAIARLAPPLVGINSRDLGNFHVDRLQPIRLRGQIDWACQVVFESGVQSGEDTALVARCGFDAALVGETVMRQPGLISELIAGLTGQWEAERHGTAAIVPASGVGSNRSIEEEGDFWRRLCERAEGHRPPLVKICGISNRSDAVAAVDAGADLLGLVYADSPRRAPLDLPPQLRDLPVLKVAVTENRIDPQVGALLRAGDLDAVQMHGNEQPLECASYAFPYYKALPLRSEQDLAVADQYRCPRILIDAFDGQRSGGTGRRLSADLVRAAGARMPLWLAGGLAPDTIAAVVGEHRPELVDVSSRLERAPGRKDHGLIRRFLDEIERVR